MQSRVSGNVKLILQAVSIALISTLIFVCYSFKEQNSDNKQVEQYVSKSNCQAQDTNHFIMNFFGFGKSVCISKCVFKQCNISSLKSPLLTKSLRHIQSKNDEWSNATSVHEFTVKDLDDQDVQLDKYKGKVLMIVNVASKCGLTKTNYKELNELYSKYREQGFAILGFPSNSFAQEPGCSVDLKEFMKKNNVEWDMFAKVDVNGDNAIPLYKWLKTKCGGTITDAIKWNFTKFLVDRHGVPVGRYAPQKSPMELESHVEAELKKN